MKKRERSLVLAELATIESQLSPENLHQDGLRSHASARKIGQRLMIRRTELHVELGGIPDETESANMYG